MFTAESASFANLIESLADVLVVVLFQAQYALLVSYQNLGIEVFRTVGDMFLVTVVVLELDLLGKVTLPYVRPMFKKLRNNKKYAYLA